MGIDYSSMMIVGVRADKIPLKDGEDLYDFVQEHGLENCAEHFDADIDSRIVGYKCPNNVSFQDLDSFLEEVKPLFDKLRQLTGCEPHLIATQDIY